MNKNLAHNFYLNFVQNENFNTLSTILSHIITSHNDVAVTQLIEIFDKNKFGKFFFFDLKQIMRLTGMDLPYELQVLIDLNWKVVATLWVIPLKTKNFKS